MTAIRESKDLNVLSLDAFIGSFRIHEIELDEALRNQTKEANLLLWSPPKESPVLLRPWKVVEEAEEEEKYSFDDNNDEKDEIAHLAMRISKA